MQVSTMFTEYFKLSPSRTNIFERTLNIPCNGNKPKQIYTLQITEVSNSAKRHADNSGNRQTVKPAICNCKLFPKSIHGPD